MSFMQVLKVLGCILPVAALCIASAKLNLSKVNRSRQFPMSIISLIYGIVMLFLFGKVETVVHFLHKIFNLLAKYLPFLQNIAWASIAIYVLNCAFLVGFIALKSILMPILAKLWASSMGSPST